VEQEVIKWFLEEDDFHDPYPIEPPSKTEKMLKTVLKKIFFARKNL